MFSRRLYFEGRTNRTVAWVWAISIGSWLILLAWVLSPYSAYLGHRDLGEIVTAPGFLTLATIFIIGWTLMVLAMMLPTALPFVAQFRSIVGGGQASRSQSVRLLAGYGAPWVIFGFAVFMLDLGVHRVAETPLFQGNVWILGTSTLVLAASYQFTSSKEKFLDNCCYPSDFIMSRLGNSSVGLSPLRTGLAYGAAAVGAHWALMLLMFALGLGSILWMLAFGIVMAVEKSRLGSNARQPIGLSLLGAAAILTLSSL